MNRDQFDKAIEEAIEQYETLPSECPIHDLRNELMRIALLHIEYNDYLWEIDGGSINRTKEKKLLSDYLIIDRIFNVCASLQIPDAMLEETEPTQHSLI